MAEQLPPEVNVYVMGLPSPWLYEAPEFIKYNPPPEEWQKPFFQTRFFRVAAGGYEEVVVLPYDPEQTGWKIMGCTGDTTYLSDPTGAMWNLHTAEPRPARVDSLGLDFKRPFLYVRNDGMSSCDVDLQARFHAFRYSVAAGQTAKIGPLIWGACYVGNRFRCSRESDVWIRLAYEPIGVDVQLGRDEAPPMVTV